MRAGGLLACLAVVGLVLGAASAGATSTAPLVVKLKEKHKSGIHGTATLTPIGEDFRVVIKLNKRVRGLAHIHTGPCKREPTFANPRIWAPLINIRAGKSTTFIDYFDYSKLRKGIFSINIHTEVGDVTACADIPRA